MKKQIKRNFGISIALLILFALWTVAVRFIDVQAIGPECSSVGFATLNRFIHNLTDENFVLYKITDWLGLVPFVFVMGFAILGIVEWIKQKSFLMVDYSILVLGGFYIATIVVYIFFEIVVINYRPVLIGGYLEASYPSSTTMLVMCVMPTTMMQLNDRIKNRMLKISVNFLITAFIAFMVIGRLISGVHWFTDIIGGAIFSAGLVMMYYSISSLKVRLY